MPSWDAITLGNLLKIRHKVRGGKGVSDWENHKNEEIPKP